jgi:methionine biosynthesis protein MetW
MERIREENINTAKFWDATYDRELQRGNIRNSRLIFKEAFKHVEGSVLDVGCGPGSFVKFLKEHGVKRVAGIDISKSAVRFANNWVGNHFRVADINKGIKLKDNAVDTITALEVLEHIENPQKALNEMLRIAKKRVIITVPNTTHINSKDHIWSFNHESLAELHNESTANVHAYYFSNNTRIIYIITKTNSTTAV